MIKIFLILIILIISVSAKEAEILGISAFNDNNVSKIEKGLFAKDNIFVSANNIIYYRNRKYLIAKDKVYITYNNNFFILSDLANLYLNTKEMKLYPFFLFDSPSYGWISSIKAKKMDTKYDLTNILSSTCSIKNPDWKIVASSGNYDRQTKWLNLYNPTFYIHTIPVAYLPYIGFSLDKKRKAGLLSPLFGYSANEGVLYSQPIYFPFSLSSDLEITPTTRTLRGRGIYSTFRFVDSAYSKGYLKVGYFKDFSSYQKKYNLQNQKHYGIMFNYIHDHPFFEKDALYLDLRYAKDVDFFYLDAYNNVFNRGYLSNKTITSVFNYAYNGDKNYFGLYSKYFIDTTKVNNKDTMQLLPELHYHRFTNSYIFSNLTSNIDLDVQNYYRSKGARYVKKSVNVPLVYHFSFFQDYLKINFHEIFYGANLNDDSNKLIADYTSLDSLIEFYTSLSKKIGTELYHNVNFNISVFTNQKKHQTGSNSYVNQTLTQDNINLKLDQYLNSEDFTLNHKISQTFYKNGKYSNIFNYLFAKYKNYSVSDNNEYSRSLSRVYYNSFTFKYTNEIFDIAWSHIYKYKSSRSYRLQSSLNISKYHKLYASYNYDYIKKEIKSWYVGIQMSKRCWNYNLKFAQEKLPILTSNGASHIKQNTIYIEVEFNPLGGFEQNFMYKE